LSDTADDEERKRLLALEVRGAMPATAVMSDKREAECFLVFTTAVLIVAILPFKEQISRLNPLPYFIRKSDWASYGYKLAEPVIKRYRCYTIPYRNITEMLTTKTGKISHKSWLKIDTREGSFLFRFYRITLDEVNTELQSLFPEAHPSSPVNSPPG
jgi:hypothetical protein